MSMITREDPLTYLPRRPLQEFARGSLIYDTHQQDDRLYVAFAGRVKVSCTALDGSQTLTRIVGPEGVFGELSLVTETRPAESATVLEKATVMAWSRSEVEAHIERYPRLGIALVQYFTAHCMLLQERIQNVAVYRTPERVTLGLVQLAEELGTPMPDGTLRITSLTHQTIAEFVGTSREIVTTEMNRLRRLGLLRYTRLYVDVQTAAMRELLREQSIRLPQGIGASHQAA